ncbi:metal-dependent transcriptional regulator [Granulicoccus phenolivorans]|uniref:metal-dependent transcriptional regulator n=1 Tax=Granulicoccus phenolivorans TaxID=266854 RepID=UPI000425B5CE|nr:metal-dependent transcriptional regulator [Granulicoccus phenolivorans]
MSELIDTTEMYLRTIFELEEEGIAPLRARIAERLGHSGPTVSQTVARMERDGLLTMTRSREIALTEAGRERATRVMRKHRLAERLLVDVIGLDLHLVHDEACRWEHVISEDVEERLIKILNRPTHSPFGNPIPGLEELGVASEPDVATQPLTEVLGGGADSVEVRLHLLSETLQVDTDLLDQLHAAGMSPGSTLSVRRSGDRVELSNDHASIEFTNALAAHLYVEVL